MAKTGTPYDIEAVRKEWVGKQTEPVPGRYPVEYDPIRRHCHMIDDDNPLFLDPDYAAKTRHGGVIAPPVMADYFAGQGIWPPSEDGPMLLREVPTPGDRMVNLINEFEYIRPIKIGERLSSYQVLADIFHKPTRLDPISTWIVSETHIIDEAGKVVAIGRNTLLTHRPPEEVAADPNGTGGSK
ncbi:MAG: MaoC family dehydratase N-terminal domain-containing protein [Dehalococcoidia bacterium]|nr:MaoC family dehydratase N-terminal domain-containing protein [Dehalococcoidia bacterium]MCB9486509.1 MaoC family dehydratase N-terminal domain-containing protein [Thermoflexaceae bacterium]